MLACESMRESEPVREEPLSVSSAGRTPFTVRPCQVHETRAGELRALIKALSEQIKPLHDTSRRHAAQIEEVSSGINVLAELLRFTNRNRTQTLADALGSV